MELHHTTAVPLELWVLQMTLFSHAAWSRLIQLIKKLSKRGITRSHGLCPTRLCRERFDFKTSKTVRKSIHDEIIQSLLLNTAIYDRG
jgi:hypothetical protein